MILVRTLLLASGFSLMTAYCVEGLQKRMTITLQKGLDQMCSWAKTWQINFNPDKYTVLHSPEKNTFKGSCTMLHQILIQVEYYPYLGVEFSHNLC